MTFYLINVISNSKIYFFSVELYLSAYPLLYSSPKLIFIELIGLEIKFAKSS